eukprot:scaffold212_cov404-Prasinococcus_capsulatus_cf.AAC.21
MAQRAQALCHVCNAPLGSTRARRGARVKRTSAPPPAAAARVAMMSRLHQSRHHCVASGGTSSLEAAKLPRRAFDSRKTQTDSGREWDTAPASCYCCRLALGHQVGIAN